MSDVKYTVFFGQGSFLASGNGDRYGLQELIDFGSEEKDPAIAWAAESVACYGGTKEVDQLRAESIAAGRTIELVDGKYIPRGVPLEEEEDDVLPLLRQAIAEYDSWNADSSEPKRVPLDWNKPTPFDPFHDFRVYSDAVSSGFAGETKQAPAHPLQRMSATGSHQFGASWVVR